jgi:DNA-binding LytR/AlgR family response regulator
MKLNCVIIDDNSTQRIITSNLVSNTLNLNLVGDFSSINDAKHCISSESIDLIFLDIEMPISCEFNYLDGLNIKPQIIFISSKAINAMKYFDDNATDYQQKMVALNCFNNSVKSAMEFHKLNRLDKVAEEEENEHIFIKSNLKKLKIYTSQIKWIEAFGDYVKVVTDDDANLVLSTMKAIEKDLRSNKFVRVHKSYIINVEKVESFNSKFAEIGVTKIPISRNKKEDLIKALSTA